MTPTPYEQACTEAERELAKLRREREQLDQRIARLEQTLAGLHALIDPEFETSLGLTDTIRQVLRASRDAISPTDIRDSLNALGTSLSGHANPMASVHAILARLVKSGEVMEIEDANGKRYWWTLNGPPRAGKSLYDLVHATIATNLQSGSDDPPPTGMARVLRDSQERRRKLLGKDK